MANLFFDANFLIDFAERQTQIALEKFKNHLLIASPLSFHILSYAYKYKVPYKKLNNLIKKFEIIEFTKDILELSSSGPTEDLEDNIQLHSAAEAEADYFLTSDNLLLNLKYFGKTKIVSNLES